MYRGRSLLFVFLLLATVTAAFSQVKVSLSSDPVWGRTNFNRVTANLSLPSANVLSRFAMELPPGFGVIGEKTQGGDLYMANNTLYIVWVKPLRSTRVDISFFVRPPAGSRDNISLEATLASISEPGGRVVVRSLPHDVTIRAGGGLTTAQVEALREKSNIAEPPPNIRVVQPALEKKTGNTIAEPVTDKPLQENLIEGDKKEVAFRVQVLTSSSELSITQLRQRTGVNLPDDLLIIQSGNLYKHLVGRTTDYKSAVSLKDRIVLAGLKGAFVVAFIGDEPVTIEQALKVSGNNQR